MRGPQHEHNDRSSVRSPEVHSAEPVLMPPPYSASGPDPSGESRAFVRKRPAWPTAVALISLHLVAGFYALQFLLQYWTSSQAPLGPPPTYNVAIIGAGPAGIAAAQRLRTSPRARGLRFNITIYEAKPVLGGALALCGANGSLVFPKDDTTQSPITAEDIAGKGLAWSNELFTRDSERVLGDSVHFLELTPEKIGPYKNNTKTTSETRHQKAPTTGLAAMMSLAWGESASMYEGGDVLDRLRRIVREIDVDVRTSARVTAIKHVEIAEGQPAWLVRHESADGSGSSIEVFDRVIMTTLDLDVKLETTSDGQTITLDLETSYNSRNPAAPAAARGESSAAPVYVSFFTTRDATVSAWLHVEDQVLFLEPENAADLRELAPVREIVVGHTDAIANNPRVEYLYRVLSSRPILEDLQKLDKITWTYQTKIEKVFPPTSQSWSPVASPFPPFTLPWAPGLWWTTTMSHAETTPTNVDQSWWAGRLAAYDLIEELSGGDEDE